MDHLYHHAKFCGNRTTHEARLSYRLDVCPSVRPSHAGIVSKRVMLSSPHDSPFILVFCVYQDLREIPTGSPPVGPLNRDRVWKCRNFRRIICYISETVEYRWVCSEAFYKHWILFPTVWHLPRLSQGSNLGRPKCAKKVLKWRTFELTC